jgi:predicted nucleotidyltransferase
MKRDLVLRRLSSARERLCQLGVGSMSLYGSCARDEANERSDVDIFVDPLPDTRFSLLDLAGVHRILVEELGCPVDVTTRSALHPALRTRIEADAIRVF